MMQSLLSKDLLYPAIRDLADRFPDWLAEKRADFSPEQFGKFNRQYELTKQICHAYEGPGADSSEEATGNQFQKIMSLMQEMQSLGNPPQELVAGGGGGGGGDDPLLLRPELANPALYDQCKVS